MRDPKRSKCLWESISQGLEPNERDFLGVVSVCVCVCVCVRLCVLVRVCVCVPRAPRHCGLNSFARCSFVGLVLGSRRPLLLLRLCLPQCCQAVQALPRLRVPFFPWVTLFVSIEMSFLGVEIFDLLFGMEMFEIPKGDLGHFDTTKRTSRCQKRRTLFCSLVAGRA